MFTCLTCKHFMGMDVDGYVYCKIRGRTRPMIICPLYEKRKSKNENVR